VPAFFGWYFTPCPLRMRAAELVFFETNDTHGFVCRMKGVENQTVFLNNLVLLLEPLLILNFSLWANQDPTKIMQYYLKLCDPVILCHMTRITCVLLPLCILLNPHRGFKNMQMEEENYAIHIISHNRIISHNIA